MNKRAMRPITLDELEEQYLSTEICSKRRSITVKEIESVRKLEDDRFRRRLGYLFAGTVVVLAAVAVIAPDRADSATSLIQSFLMVISGYVLGRYGLKGEQASP